MRAIKDFLQGFNTFITGVRWLKKRPSLLFLLSIPWLLGIIAVVAMLQLFFHYDQQLIEAIVFEPGQSMLSQLLFSIAKLLVYISAVMLVLIAGFLSANIFTAPIYEYISIRVERDLTGQNVSELSLLASIKLIPEELKKVCFILFVSLIVLVIPGLNLITLLVSAFLIGWDVYDYPLARRGWSLKRRLRFIREDFFSILGLGIWLTIPFVQLILLPLAVAGGSMLAVKRLQDKDLINSIE